MSDHEPEKKGHGGGHAAGGHGHGGGGHEEHEGAPEWLVSFADNVTLMMGFFVIMLAFSMGPKGGSESKGKETGGDPPTYFMDAAVAIREAFNNPVDLNSMDPNDPLLVQHILARRGLGVSEQVVRLSDELHPVIGGEGATFGLVEARHGGQPGAGDIPPEQVLDVARAMDPGAGEADPQAHRLSQRARSRRARRADPRVMSVGPRSRI